MDEQEKQRDIETLAKMAARLAGHDPDSPVRIKLGDLTAFDDVAWRYEEYLKRAEAAYERLADPCR